MRKKMANDKVIKAMAVGLSAVISLSTPMTAMAAEGDVDNTPGPTDERDTKNESNQTAESAIQKAKDSTSSTETNTVDIDKKNQTTLTDGSPVEVTPDAAEAAQAEVLKDVEAEVEKEDITETVTYENVAENEQAAKESLVNAEVDLIQKDASEQAADVAVNKADGIVKEIETNIDEIEVANGAAKEAVEAADEAAKKANSATTAAEVNAAIEEIEAAQAKLEEQQAEAQANYDENVEKLAAAEAELKAAEEALAAAAASLNASKEDIAKAQAAVDEAAKEAEALKKAVDDEAKNLKNTQVDQLKAAYDKMMAESVSRKYTGKSATAEDANQDGIGDEFTTEFGTESASSAYWNAADAYFELYLKYVYGDSFVSGSWSRSINDILENPQKDYVASVDNTYTVTYKDENGEKKTAYYNYHTCIDEKFSGDITIYEKEIATGMTETISEEVLSIDNGDGTYTKLADVQKDTDVVITTGSNEAGDATSVLVKDDNSELLAEENKLAENQKVVEGTSKDTYSVETYTTYTYGTKEVQVDYTDRIGSYANLVNKLTEWEAKYSTDDYRIEIVFDHGFKNDEVITLEEARRLDLLSQAGALFDCGFELKAYQTVEDEDNIISQSEKQVIVKTTTATVETTTYKEMTESGTAGDRNRAERAAKARAQELGLNEGEYEVDYDIYYAGRLDWDCKYTIKYKVLDEPTTSTQEVKSETYSATAYNTNTVTLEESVEYQYWTERRNTSKDEDVRNAISGYKEALASMKSKQDAAAIALAAAKQAQADVAAAKLALENKSLAVDKEAYNTALGNYEAALEAQEKLEEKLKEIENAVIQAEEDFADAEEELARFIPIPVEDDDDDDDDDAAAGDFADAAVVTPVVTTIMPDAVPLAATPAAVADVADDVDAEGDDEDGNGGVVIEDNETPLAGDIEETLDAEEVTIEDEETPLAAAPIEKMSWWWLLIVALLGATGYEMYRKHQAKKAQVTDTDK